MFLSKLALGTAQFGYDYGITNKKGKINFNEQEKIIRYAKKVGIDIIDTAISYGESEANLGLCNVQNFKIVTKIPTLPKGLKNINYFLQEEFQKSLNRLKVDTIYALLLHKSDDIIKYDGKVIDFLINLKKLGRVKKIGVSIYSPLELERVLKNISLDIIQIPLNIIDNRFLHSGWLEKLKKLNIEIHARSVFLQGILLVPRSKLPKKFEVWSDIWNKWYNLQNKYPNINSMQICIGFVNTIKDIDRIVVGVESLKQLREIVEINIDKKIIYPDISSNDDRLINPFNWKSL